MPGEIHQKRPSRFFFPKAKMLNIVFFSACHTQNLKDYRFLVTTEHFGAGYSRKSIFEKLLFKITLRSGPGARNQLQIRAQRKISGSVAGSQVPTDLPRRDKRQLAKLTIFLSALVVERSNKHRA